MQIFVTGTGTDVGKTVVCSWLCLQTGYHYFKPIQTGSALGTDSQTIKALTSVTVHAESYVYGQPFSPHKAALLEGGEIDDQTIELPSSERLIIEGAGGLMVPINKNTLMIDLIQRLNVPVILVAASGLGTINHTLLSLLALRNRTIPVLGVIVNGPLNQDNEAAIAEYGRTSILAALPHLSQVTTENLKRIPLTDKLKKILELT